MVLKINRPERCNSFEQHYWGKPLLDQFFKSNNASMVKNASQSDLFLPCGYNNTNDDLKKIGKTKENQYIFGIYNEDVIVSKSSIWTQIEKKYGRNYARKIMPETYVLSNPNHMNILSRDFNPKNKYIMKNVLQGKKGLKLTNDLSELLNGHKEKYLVAQKYVNDILTINKKKLNLRFYMLIICKNGQKDFYLYDNGICIYTLKDYNSKSNNMEENITSYKFDGKIYSVNPLTLDELKQYFKKQGKNEKLIMKKIYDICVAVASAVKFDICNFKNIDKSTSFELFGGDIIFDSDYNPYILELNKGPDMKPNNYDDPRYEKTKKEVFTDIFDLVGIKKSKKKNRFHKLNA